MFKSDAYSSVKSSYVTIAGLADSVSFPRSSDREYKTVCLEISNKQQNKKQKLNYLRGRTGLQYEASIDVFIAFLGLEGFWGQSLRHFYPLFLSNHVGFTS